MKKHLLLFTLLLLISGAMYAQNCTIVALADPEDGGRVSGGGDYATGDTCTLNAAANEGYKFQSWTKNDTIVSSEPTYEFIVTDSATYVAHFELLTQSCTITATADPEDGGRVSGGGDYAIGDTCTLNATANEGYEFQSWTKNDTIVSSEPIYEFTVTESATYVAHFELLPQSCTITATADPEEGGTVSGGGEYAIGDTCILTATPNTNFTFTNWKKGNTIVSTDRIYSFEVTEDATYIATFTPIPQYTITVKANNDDWGTVDGGGQYLEGVVCTLHATPASGHQFDNWKLDDVAVSDNPDYSFEVREDATYVAYFSRKQYTITGNASPTWGGNVDGSGTYYYGDTVTLSASPSEGYTFDHWDDNNTENPRYVIVTGDMSFTAVFTRIIIHIEEPDAICSGESLTLTEPWLPFGYWQLAPTDAFDSESTITYTDQPLDASYNGWYLRYHINLGFDEWDSNVVQITVNKLKGLRLEGDVNVGLNQKVEYQVIDSLNNYAHYSYNWSVSDEQADTTIIGNSCKVLWKTVGMKQVSVIVTDNTTGCSDTLDLEVEVSSCINESDIHEIEAKASDNGIQYILVYPNPKDTYLYQWYRDDNPIPNANKQYYYEQGGLTHGDYVVHISLFKEEDCGAFSRVFRVEENQSNPSNRLSVYPNPAHANGSLFVVNDSESEALLSIYSIDGRLLHSQTVTGVQADINAQLPQGIYVICLIGESGFVKVEKLVIQQ